MNKNCIFYLVRHGQTDWNVKGLVQGQTDVPLNENGQLQAKELGDRLKNIHFSAVFSSDLMRAKRTAEIIVQEKKLAVITNKALRERDFGDFEGKKSPFLLAWRKALREGIKKLTDEEKKLLESKNNPKIEKDEEILKRLIPFLKEVAIAYQGKKVLIVTHGGLMRVFLIHLGFFKDEKESFSYKIKNTAYFILESDGVEFFVKETWGIDKVSE